MRAIIFDGREPKFVEAHPEPATADAGEAVVRTTRAAISRVDIEVTRGLGDFTGVLGHQFVGIVEQVGQHAGHELIGSRVVGSVSTFCGTCPMCQAGLSNHCRQRTLLGIEGRDGCFADRFAIPVANLVPVPDSVDDDQAVFAEPLAAAVQAARQLTIEGKPFVTVLGDGPVGMLTAQVMARLNASVRVIGRYSQKLSVCEKWQLKHRHIDDIGRRADQDIVVDCTGSPTGLELALQLVRPRGTIVIKTLTAPASRLVPGTDLSSLIQDEITVIGSHRGPVGEAISLIARGDVDVVSLIARRVNLADVPGALTTPLPGAMRTLVSF